MITDTENNIGNFFKLEGNDEKVSIRDFGSYVRSSTRSAIIKDTSVTW